MADYDIISAGSGTRERGHAALTRSFVGQDAHNNSQTANPPLRHLLPVRETSYPTCDLTFVIPEPCWSREIS